MSIYNCYSWTYVDIAWPLWNWKFIEKTTNHILIYMTIIVILINIGSGKSFNVWVCSTIFRYLAHYSIKYFFKLIYVTWNSSLVLTFMICFHHLIQFMQCRSLFLFWCTSALSLTIFEVLLLKSAFFLLFQNESYSLCNWLLSFKWDTVRLMFWLIYIDDLTIINY